MSALIIFMVVLFCFRLWLWGDVGGDRSITPSDKIYAVHVTIWNRFWVFYALKLNWSYLENSRPYDLWTAVVLMHSLRSSFSFGLQSLRNDGTSCDKWNVVRFRSCRCFPYCVRTETFAVPNFLGNISIYRFRHTWPTPGAQHFPILFSDGLQQSIHWNSFNW